MLTKSNFLIFSSIFFALGILFASAFNFSGLVSLMALFLSLLAFLYCFLIQKYFGAQAALFFLVFALGMLRLQSAEINNQFTGIFEQKKLLEGLVVEEPDVRENRQLITFLPDGFNQNLLLTTTKAQSFFYGDRLAVEGKVVSAKAFDDFDYPKYLERFNVYALEKYPKILILKSRRGLETKYWLLKIKTAFSDRIAKYLSEPQASLLLGILIGARKTLPQNIVENFNQTGVSHIIAVSGFNITIIISGLMAFSYLFGRRLSFWISLFLIFAFTIIAGASASVVRAAIMGGLLLLAMNIGRQYKIVPSLFLAALIMLAINPKILFWDIGFQLSFAATLGIVFFVPEFSKHLENSEDFFGLKPLLITTMAAIISTMPLVLLHFGRLSLVAPVVNLLILPFLPYIMLLGFLVALPVLGAGCAFAVNLLLIYVLKVTSFFAGLKFSALDLPFGPISFWALTGLIFIVYYFIKNKKITRVDENKPV